MYYIIVANNEQTLTIPEAVNKYNENVVIIAQTGTVIPIEIVSSWNRPDIIVLEEYDIIHIIYEISQVILSGNNDEFTLITSDRNLLELIGNRKELNFGDHVVSVNSVTAKSNAAKPKKKPQAKQPVVRNLAKKTDDASNKTGIDQNGLPDYFPADKKIESSKKVTDDKASSEITKETVKDSTPVPTEKKTVNKPDSKPQHSPAGKTDDKIEILKKATGEKNTAILNEMLEAIKKATDDGAGLVFMLKLNLAVFGYRPDACEAAAEKIRPVFNELRKG